jgi:hypothetical protein
MVVTQRIRMSQPTQLTVPLEKCILVGGIYFKKLVYKEGDLLSQHIKRELFSFKVDRVPCEEIVLRRADKGQIEVRVKAKGGMINEDQRKEKHHWPRFEGPNIGDQIDPQEWR